MSSRKLFLVSGGSGGIGAAVCGLLAEKGFLPIVGYHRGAQAAEAVARNTGGRSLPLDLTSELSIAAAVATLVSSEAALAGVVLAGSPPLVIGPFGKITSEDMLRQWQVQVMGPQRLLADLVRQCFRKAKQGIVIGVLSKAMGEDGCNASPGMGAYVIAKYGLAGVLAMLAADYPWLHVSSVKPGYTETRMLDVFDERFLNSQRDREPFQTPEQAAALIVEEALKND